MTVQENKFNQRVSFTSQGSRLNFLKEQRRSPFAAMSSTAYTRGGNMTGKHIASFKPFTGSCSVAEVADDIQADTSMLLQNKLAPLVGTVR